MMWSFQSALRLTFLLTWVCLAFPSRVVAAPPGDPASQAARTVVELSDDWRFRLGDPALDATREDFDDATWARVSVPHSWNRVGFYHAGVKTAINTPDVIDKSTGVGWYRRKIAVPETMRGKQIWLEFDAASRVATVWLNGQRLGSHEGGYSRFRLDATKAVRFGADNVLAVKTDNTVPKPGAATEHVLPLSGDFYGKLIVHVKIRCCQ